MEEYKEIIQKLYNSSILINPYYIDIRNIYKQFDNTNKIFDKFIYLIYLSLDTEMNARISQVYPYLYEFNSKDENFLMEKLKMHKNWEFYEMLKNFDSENFLKTFLNDVGVDGAMKITNEFITKFKDKDLNKRSKILNFIDTEIKNINDLEIFYTNWKKYFYIKSESHLNKFNFIIKEVIEDLNGNRPFNEDFRVREKYNFLF